MRIPLQVHVHGDIYVCICICIYVLILQAKQPLSLAIQLDPLAKDHHIRAWWLFIYMPHERTGVSH